MDDLGRCFEVYGGEATYSLRRQMTVGWTVPSAPVSIVAISMRGIELEGLPTALLKATRVRLELTLNRVPRFAIEGRVVACKRVMEDGYGTMGKATWKCTVMFASYDGTTWAQLRAAENWHVEARQSRTETPVTQAVATA